MLNLKFILRYLFNRAIVLNPGSLRNKIRHCQSFMFYDFIAMFICTAVVVFSSSEYDVLFVLGLAFFSISFILDFLQWMRFTNLYFKYYEGGVIFEDPKSDTVKDSEKEI